MMRDVAPESVEQQVRWNQWVARYAASSRRSDRHARLAMLAVFGGIAVLIMMQLFGSVRGA